MTSGVPIPKDRRCITCGSPSTYIRPDGHQVWHSHPDYDDKYDCTKCYRASERYLKYQREYAIKWRMENHDRYRAYQNAYIPGWYRRHPEKRHEYYMKNYYLYGGRIKIKEYQKIHREEILEYKRKHRKENLEAYKERDRKKYLRRKENEYKKSREAD